MTAFGLNSWTTGDAVDAVTDARVAGEAGYRFIEYRDAKIERHLAAGGTLASLRAAVEEAGVAVLSVNTLEDATLHTGAGLDSVVERCRTLAAWAQALACPYVIAGPSYLPPDGIEQAVLRKRSVESLRRIVEAAGARGVRVGFEYHGYANCSVHTLADAMSLIEAVGDPRLGIVLDAFHFYVGGSAWEELDRIDAARIFIVHLDDVEHGDRARLRKPDRTIPGEGVLPLRDMVRRIRGTGYDGAWSIEIFREEYWAKDPRIVARRGLDGMRSLFD